MADKKHVLMVVTSHPKITDEVATGLWLEEYAVPYNIFKEKGYDVTTVSIEGGEVPLDPNSIPKAPHPEWVEAEGNLSHTEKLTTDHGKGFDAIFLPGGHGTMFDFPNNKTLQEVLRDHHEQGNVIGSVCHGPSGLVYATDKTGTSLITGKEVTGFTDSEEKEMQLENAVPFMLETEMRKQDAHFRAAENWSDHSVRDGWLVTGQNPMSSGSTAEKMVEALEEK